MAVKSKVNIPLANIQTDHLPVEVELDEKGLGGALALLLQDKLKLDAAQVGNLTTDEEHNVFLLNRDHNVESKVSSNKPEISVLVDAMHVLIFGSPKHLSEQGQEKDSKSQ